MKAIAGCFIFPWLLAIAFNLSVAFKIKQENKAKYHKTVSLTLLVATAESMLSFYPET